MIVNVGFFAGCVALVYYAIKQLGDRPVAKIVTPKKLNPQLETALTYAGKLFSQKKYLASEKAYLEVIKHDHKNITAYNRLGRIYMLLKNYPDAIECCQIASQLSPGAATYFNLGSAYYENKNFIKAIAAHEKALMFEPSAGRYVGLGRAYQRLSNWPKVVATYEKAVELEPTRAHQLLLLEAYRATNNLAGQRALRLAMSAKPPNPTPSI